MTTHRPLGHIERYSLVRTVCGIPSTISLLASGTSDVLDLTRLDAAISQLLARHTLLSCHVDDKHSKKPVFISRSMALKEVVETRDDNTSTDTPQLLQSGIEALLACDVEKGPFWKVLAIREQEGLVIVQFTINHTITDGNGSKALFAELLSLLRPSAAIVETATTPSFPPAQETIIVVKPSMMHIAKVLTAELLLAALPRFLRPTPPAKSFPTGPFSFRPADKPMQTKYLSIPVATIQRIKVAGKKHGVKTLHPTLHVCMIGSLADTIESHKLATLPTNLTINTPRSIRHEAPEAPSALGNYISDLSTLYSLSPSASSAPFWNLASSFATSITSPAALAKAKYEIGMLGWIPDPQGEKEKNGWEEWVEKKLNTPEGASPFRTSLEFSNLGLINLGEGLESVDVAWSQTPSPVGPALNVNAISTSNGPLNITITYKQDVFTDVFVDDLAQGFETMMDRVANDEEVLVALRQI